MAALTKEEIESLEFQRDFTGETEAQMANRLFRENTVASARSIIDMALNAPSDRIRLQAATYVVERILGRIQDNPPKQDDDPYMSLIAECVRNYDADAA